MSVTVNGTSGLVFGDGTIQGTAAGTSFRNRIINGDMRVAQRGSSAAGLANTAGYRCLDRWRHFLGATTSPTYTISTSTDAPAGFASSQKVLVTTGAAMSADGTCILAQDIEGTYLSDFSFGTASAATFTVSFWVKSNVVGTYVVEPYTIPNLRTIGKTYTINAANTWEYKTLTFVGDTSSAMNTDFSTGIRLHFWFAAGTNSSSGTLNASWASASTQANRAAGMNASFGTTANNYVNITGVQLEKAGAATSFETRPFAVEYALCRRYYQHSAGYGAMPTPGTYHVRTGIAASYNNAAAESCVISFNAPMRAAPTMTYTRPTHSSGNNNSWAYYGNGSGWYYPTSATISSLLTENMFSATIPSTANNGSTGITEGGWIADAEL